MVLLPVLSTPMRTLPASAFTALPRVTGHAVGAVFAEVIVMGVVGQYASAPALFTVRTLTRSPATSVMGVAVSTPRSNHWLLTAGLCRRVRVSVSDELPLVTSRFTVTLLATVGEPRFSVALALVGFVMLYRPGFSESTVHEYERLLPEDPLPFSW